MIKTWAKNLLGAALGRDDTDGELVFNRPATTTTPLRIKIDDEELHCSAWGATVNPLTNSTFGVATPATRGYNGTQRAEHPVKTPVYFEEIGTTEDAAKLSATVDADFSTANGLVTKVIPRGDGKYWVCGSFTSIGGVARNYVALVDSNGDVVTDFNAAITTGTTVHGVAETPDGLRVIIWGDFTVVDAQATPYICIYLKDGDKVTREQTLGFDAPILDAVIDVDDSGTYLYCVGSFSTPVYYLAKYSIDGSSFTHTGFDYDFGPVGRSLDSIAIHEDRILTNGTTVVEADTGGTPITNLGQLLWIIDKGTPNKTTIQFGPDGGQTFIVQDEYDQDYFYLSGGASATNNVVVRMNAADYSLDASFDPGVAVNTSAAYFIGNTEDQILVGYTTAGPTYRAGAFDKTTGADQGFAPALDSVPRTGLWVDGNYWLGGNFTTPGTRFVRFNRAPIVSHYGYYYPEVVVDAPATNPPVKVELFVYDGPLESATLLSSEVLTDYDSVDSEGYHFAGQEVQFVVPDKGYLIVANIYFTDGSSETERFLKISGVAEGILLEHIGEESGHLVTLDSAFNAPTVGFGGTTYTVTPQYVASVPVADNVRNWCRYWVFIDPASNAAEDIKFEYWVVTVIDVVGGVRYVTGVVEVQHSGAGTTITVTARDVGTATITTTGALPLSSTASNSNVNADHIQIEVEGDGGPLQGVSQNRHIIDWDPVTIGGVYQFANIGPSANMHRFRCRFRAYRRDGMSGVNQPIAIMSRWSAWSSYT